MISTHLIRQLKIKENLQEGSIPALRRELRQYIVGMEDHESLFKSREDINKPIGRNMAYEILQEAAM